MDNIIDFKILNYIKKGFNSLRIGEGYDVHKLVENRDLILAGVKIDYKYGLLGHSDADVITHAIIDSILGAASLSDIGSHFPDNDDKYKNISSILLLKNTLEIINGNNIKNKKYEIINIDSTIVCQMPKLNKYINTMRNNIANALNIDIDNINIKATTEEGLGFTGEQKGIAARAICLLKEI